MIMKRDLRLRNYNYLAMFISGKVDSSVAKKYNKKKIEKMVMSHALYEDWISEYSFALSFLNKDKILGDIQTVVSCPITVVEYEYPDICDSVARPHDENAIDEMIRFMVSL